jgi:hypothetical protein
MHVSAVVTFDFVSIAARAGKYRTRFATRLISKTLHKIAKVLRVRLNLLTRAFDDPDVDGFTYVMAGRTSLVIFIAHNAFILKATAGAHVGATRTLIEVLFKRFSDWSLFKLFGRLEWCIGRAGSDGTVATTTSSSGRPFAETL